MNKSYTDNYSEDLVLFEQPVQFTYTDATNKTIFFQMQLPNLRLLLFDEKFKRFLALINSTTADFAELNKMFTFSSMYELVIEFNRHVSIPVCATYRDLILYSYAALGINLDMYFEYYTIDGSVIQEDLFDRINFIILNCCGLRTLREQMMTDKEREMQRKIQRIKNQNKESQAEKADFQNFYIILRYEYKMTNDEILSMTLKKARNLVGYGGKFTNYLVNLIAYGNGHIKKLKHYTEKK